MTDWQHFKCHEGHTYFGVLGQRCPHCRQIEIDLGMVSDE